MLCWTVTHKEIKLDKSKGIFIKLKKNPQTTDNLEVTAKHVKFWAQT